MFEIIRMKNGKWLAVRIWRVIIYVDRHDFPTLRHGGIMATRLGERAYGKHLFWRFCFIGFDDK